MFTNQIFMKLHLVDKFDIELSHFNQMGQINDRL